MRFIKLKLPQKAEVHMLKKVHLLILAMLLALYGCGGTVKYVDPNIDARKKIFSQPSEGMSGIYIYRDGYLGSKVNTEVFVDGKILGKNLGWTYLFVEVAPGKHTIASHFIGYSTIEINTEKDQLYFIQEELDTGMLETKVKLHIVDKNTGQQGVKKCKLVETAM